ncbi:hypothetical protein BPLS_P6108 [Bathymodiolus platifrons methanotrophic gill symbiont]|nr:hypothetical protein BPLS_P6108 [Bathymodiolus platifrons methanotrophic gill symbiont]
MLQPPCVRHRLSTKQLSHGYHKWLYGFRDKILASLARYRALRIGKFPCAFWRLSSRPGLTAAEDILFNAEEGWSGVSIGNELSGAGEPDLTEGERRQFREDKRRLVAAAKRLEEESKRLAAEAAAEEAKRLAAEARANDYPELSLTWAKVFYLYRDEPVDLHRTFSYYPEFTGWHVFQTYGPTDTVMEIYHNGQSIVDIGKSDGDDGHDNNELQHKYLVEGERYVIQVYLQSKTNRGRIVLNVWAEEPFSEYKTPLTLGLAKKFWLPTDDYDQTHFTTKFTPETTGRYNIETYSADEDTVMEIYHPDGHSMVARGESAGAPCYLTKFRDSCRHNSFTYAADGRCPERPASATTTHKSRFVITTSLAGRLFGMQFLLLSRAASTRRISELPCRLSGTKNHHFAKLRFHDFQRLKWIMLRSIVGLSVILLPLL